MSVQNELLLLEKIFTYANTSPDKIALKLLEGDYTSFQTLTYRELKQKILSVSTAIEKFQLSQDQKIIRQKPILLIFDSSIEYIVSFLAILKTNNIAVTAYPPTKTRHLQRLKKIIENSNTGIIITTSQIRDYCDRNNFTFQDNTRMLCFDEMDLNTIEVFQTEPAKPSDIAFLQYTSGSTGQPKGVMVTHKNLATNLNLLAWHIGAEALPICVSWLPIFHDMGLIACTLLPLYCGSTCIFMSPMTFLKKPLFWLQKLSDEKATYTAAPNFAYDLVSIELEKNKGENFSYDFSHAKFFINAAEPVRIETIKRIEQQLKACQLKSGTIKSGYGMAETTLVVSLQSPEPVTQFSKINKEIFESGKNLNQMREGEALEFVRCGKISNHYNFRIVDPNTSCVLSKHSIGELWLQGESIAAGYYKNQEKTNEIFNAFTSDTKEGPFLKTGDLGFIDADGFFIICGRVKDLIIVNGRNIYPQDIEAACYAAHPALIKNSAAAFSISGKSTEECVIVAEINNSLDQDTYQKIFLEIKKAVSDLLDITLYDIVFIHRRKLLKTSSGKIQRSACKQAYLNNAFQPLMQMRNTLSASSVKELKPDDNPDKNLGSSELKIWLKHWINENTGMPLHDITDECAFSDLNLSSITIVAMIGALENLLNCTLDSFLAWEYPNIQSLSDKLSKEVTKSNDSVKSEFEAIAVIGMDCKIPGPDRKNITSKESFWDFLKTEESNIQPIPADRWDNRAFYDPEPNKEGKMYSSAGAFLSDIKKFNAKFFNISPREAEYLDPQQRLALMVTWNAIEDAGIIPKDLQKTRTGIYLGISTHDYDALIQKNVPRNELSTYQATGTSFSTAAGRLAYFFGTQGPCMAIDTACSSSLVSIHEACRSLQANDCELAIAGGVNLILAPDGNIIFCKSGMLSKNNRCSTFDASADGYVRGEGCGIVILKTLKKALADGNKIYAVIRGSSVNQDGASNGLTAPNLSAQTDVMEQALKSARLNAAEIDHVEAHGTGTALGDPIEWEGIRRVYGAKRESNLYVTSLKTRIGHLEAAAGVLGFIKTVLAVNKGEIPLHLNLKTFNPKIKQQENMIVPKKTEVWQAEHRYAAVSSFGFSGTNAHIILSNITDVPAVPVTQLDKSILPCNLLLVSAHKDENLKKYLERYAGFINKCPDLDIRSLCTQSQIHRTHFSHRAFIVVNNYKDLMDSVNSNAWQQNNGCAKKELAWLFTGQGCLSNNIARNLYDGSTHFSETIDLCCELSKEHLNYNLRDALLNTPENIDINNTLYAQPALFVYEYSLAHWFMRLGIKPDIMLGHSLGEYVAACLSEVMSLTDTIKLVCLRARLMAALPDSGLMLAISASVEKVTALIKEFPEIVISVKNSPQQVVVSGPAESIKRCNEHCQASGLDSKLLKTSHAFHSPLMQPMLENFYTAANKISYCQPTIPIVLNVTGQEAEMNSINAKYWCDHITNAVEFEQGIKTLSEKNITLCQEIGPKPIAITQAQMTYDCTTIATIVNPDDPWPTLVGSLGQLYLHGIEVNWCQLIKNSGKNSISNPRYPFLGGEHWLVETNLMPTQTGTWKTHLYRPVWQKLNPKITTKNNTNQPILVLIKENNSEIQEAFEKNLQSNSLAYMTISDFINEFENHTIDFNSIIYICECHDSELIEEADRLRRITQFLIKNNLDTQFVFINNHQSIVGQALLGMLKSIKQEYPEWPVRYFEGDLFHENNQQWIKYINDSEKSQWAQRCDKNEFSGQVIEALPPELLPEERKIYPEHTYLITGANGDLGQLIVESLLEQGAKNIVAIGRKINPDPWSAAISNYLNAGAKLDYRSCDTGDLKTVKNLISNINTDVSPLISIIHAAGAIDDKLWLNTTHENLALVMSGKAMGALNLHLATLNIPIKEFICISSISGTFGNQGQAAYAAANAFLDALCDSRRKNNLPAFNIITGPVNGKGFFKNTEKQLKDSLSKLNIKPLDPIEIKNIISSNGQQQNIILANFKKELTGSTESWVNQILYGSSQEEITTEEIQSEDSLSIVLNFARTILRASKNDFSETTHWFEFGMDSIMATQLANKVNAKFNRIMISTQDVFEFNCASDLAKKIDSMKISSSKKSEPSVNTQRKNMPLSLQQQEVWNFMKCRFDPLAYQMPMILKINGELNTARLKESILTICEAHDVFRLSFYESLGQVNQHKMDKVKLEIDVKERYEESEVTQFIKAPFDFSRPPLMRTKIFQNGSNEFYWVIVFHHLICDGYTFSNFIKDVINCYETRKIEAPQSQYTEFVNWQWDTIHYSINTSLLDFWRERLKEVPVDVPNRLLIKDSKKIKACIVSKKFNIPDISDTVKELNKNKLTLNNYFLASLFETLLDVFNRDKQGIVVFFSGREHSAFSAVYGDISNDVVLISDKNKNIYQHTQALQEQTLSLIDSQYLRMPILKEHGLELPRVSYDFQTIDLKFDSDNLDISITKTSNVQSYLWGDDPRFLSFKVLVNSVSEVALSVKYRADKISVETAQLLTDKWLDNIQKKRTQNKLQGEYQQASILQENLWSLYQKHPDGSPYYIPILKTIDKSIEVEKLSAAIQACIQENPALRTAFLEDDNRLKMYVSESAVCNLEVIHTESLIETLAKSLQKRIDISSPPLFSSSIIFSQNENPVLFIKVHHLIADGLSAELLINAIEKHYFNSEISSHNAQIQDDNYKAIYANSIHTYNDNLERHKHYFDSISKSLKDFGYLERESLEPCYYGGILYRKFSKTSAEAVSVFCKNNHISKYTFYLTIFCKTISDTFKTSLVYTRVVKSNRAQLTNPDMIGYYADNIPFLAAIHKDSDFIQQAISLQSEILYLIQTFEGPLLLDDYKKSCFVQPPYIFNHYTIKPEEALFNSADYLLETLINEEKKIPYWNYDTPEIINCIARSNVENDIIGIIYHPSLIAESQADDFLNSFEGNVLQALAMKNK